jgi:methylmalonyl-CoA carboxyltransferase large subunit
MAEPFMKTEKVKLQQVLDAVEALRDEVHRLAERVSALEAGAASAHAPAASPDDQRLSEELVLTLSAAIAAYLGVKPRIRQIRLLSNDSWAQKGRASIQASHILSVQDR